MATREEILGTYSNNQIKATWSILGGLYAKNDTKVYNRNSLYVVDNEYSKIDGYLLLCTNDKIGKCDWELASRSDGDDTEIEFSNNIISPNFKVIMDKTTFDQSDETTVSEDFIPFDESKSKIANSGEQVFISDDDYELCIRCLGAPFIQEDELEYTRDQIVNLAIKPALERYFKWFPKTVVKTYNSQMGQQMEVPFPTGAYDILHFSVQQGVGASSTSGSAMANGLVTPMYQQVLYMNSGLGSTMTGTYSNHYKAPTTSLNSAGSFVEQRATNQAYINYSHRYHVRKVRHDDGTLWAKFYTDKFGFCEIHYAVRTYNFDDVEFARRPELIKLCNAEVKKLFGNLRRQIKAQIPGMVDYSSWLQEADTEINEVNESWKQIVKYSSAIRGSL